MESWSRDRSLAYDWLLHLVLQALGAGCLGLGLASSWELDTRTQSHLVTMHSWTGAAAAGLVILQVNTLQSATFPRMYIQLLINISWCSGW